jgi:hypothetical protein
MTNQPKPSPAEIKNRIQQEIDHFNGNLPERVAICWDGYIAALLEWNLISIQEHKELSDMLPEVPDNPVTAIFLGREDK